MTADADQERPQPPNESTLRLALSQAGVDLTGASRDASGNSRITRPRVDASRFGDLAASLGVSTDGRAPVGGLASKDADIAEAFVAWQERRRQEASERTELQKARLALEAIQRDHGALSQQAIERERDRQLQKAARKAQRSAMMADPHIREATAWKRSLKKMRKRLAEGDDAPAAVEAGYAHYVKHGGSASHAKFVRRLRAGA